MYSDENATEIYRLALHRKRPRLELSSFVLSFVIAYPEFCSSASVSPSLLALVSQQIGLEKRLLARSLSHIRPVVCEWAVRFDHPCWAGGTARLLGIPTCVLLERPSFLFLRPF